MSPETSHSSNCHPEGQGEALVLLRVCENWAHKWQRTDYLIGAVVLRDVQMGHRNKQRINNLSLLPPSGLLLVPPVG